MKWLIVVGIVVAALAALAGVVALVGSRLPQAHVASRQTQLKAPPEAVWQAITEVDRFSAWRDGVSRVERMPDRAGKTTWVEHGSHGKMTLTIDRAEPPRLLAVRIADPDLPFGGTWTYEISPSPGGSTLKITEHGEVYNPIFRFMARYVFGHEATLATYLASIEKKFAGPAARS
jgi:uncharacterized protein YndB with AHSA1/START domain